ncbi:MAG: group 2 family glycosyl transferase [Bryobacterales bacterium]|jgi:glycosyltransferase involved in cell wall biosynthesis|nr:group 2 family glycosyl transferase [Bryobacterales bacterium]
MSRKVSFVIPTWNGSHCIHYPLAGLAGQRSDGFEVIVVDNNSTDGLANTVSENAAWREMANRGIACRIVHEPRAGATYARIRGLVEATADLICFLDDDNEPAPGYLEAGIAALSDPAVGVLVSRIFPEYELPPPSSILKREHLFAINYRLGDESIEWGPVPAFAPTVTAGMWVRREAFLKAVPWRDPDQLLADRKGGSLASGGDIEIGYLIGRAGYTRVYVPEMLLLHHIPRTRLESAYFCRLIKEIVRAQITLRARYLRSTSVNRERAWAAGKFLLALLAVPVLALRADGSREALFVLVNRWAQFQGPYPVPRTGEPNL